MMKRFSVTSITRDREYDITKGTPRSRILYFTANPNGEAEVVSVFLRATTRAKKLKFDVNFADLAVKGRSAGGNLVTKHPIRKIELSEEGVSTLGALKVWYDETVRRLNADGRGQFLGDFKADDRILVVLSTGEYLFTGFDLSTHFDEKMIHLEKWNPDRPLSAVYYEGEKEDWYVKRFLPEYVAKPFSFIGDHENSRLGVISTLHHPHVRIRYNRRYKETRDREDDVLDLHDFIAVKGMRALGNKLSPLPVTEVSLDPAVEELEASAEATMQDSRPEPIEDAASDEVPRDPSAPIAPTLFDD
jgi:topoisomerase-4 subunit A